MDNEFLVLLVPHESIPLFAVGGPKVGKEETERE
jgi:hypothetical protein